MSVDISLRTISLKLYHFLCQNIVGTQETVRTKRLMFNISDSLDINDNISKITSGSVGEGLGLHGSDLDLMFVENRFVVHEDTENVKLDPERINLVMETKHTKPGFTLLRFVDFHANFDINEMLLQRGDLRYLSSELFKSCCLKSLCDSNPGVTHIHGPCLSDKYEKLDFAYCFHNPRWIQPAANFISRGHISWPSSEVKSDIIDHGVLFVPIGCKGSVNEELEWRISFSVAEKLLIYSFSHTQFLCYALMKILLKDIINSNINCKNLLCSYFIKTIIFWVSEEIPVAEWKPENLIECFMTCLRKLLYCAEYSLCPHYFIPTINMFENKIEAEARQLLLEHLYTIFSFGWRCLLFSKQLNKFLIHSHALPSTSEIKSAQFVFLLTSQAIYATQAPDKSNYRRCIKTMNVSKSSIIKLIYLRYTSGICSAISQIIVTHSDINKRTYSKRRTQLSYLLQNIHHDAIIRLVNVSSIFLQSKTVQRCS